MTLAAQTPEARVADPIREVMTVAAAEAAVGLAIILASFRNRTTLDAAQLSSLKW